MLNVTDSFTNCMLFLRIVGVILIAVDVLYQYKRYNASSVQCKVKLLFFREMFMNLDLSCNDCTCSIHQSYFIISTSFSEKCWTAAFVAPNTCCMFTLVQRSLICFVFENNDSFIEVGHKIKMTEYEDSY